MADIDECCFPVRLIIIMINIMAEKSHPGHRPRYIEFRFQESLRRYQQPPRKLVKLNQSVCRNCCRKSCQSGRESRLIRLCETRRLYHATSREKASEFSRKRQAIQLSHDKVSGRVSDFNCTDNNNIPDSGRKDQKSSGSVMKCNLNAQSLQPQPLCLDYNRISWSVQIQETPIKQQVREQLRNMENSQIKQEKQEKQDNQLNAAKVKDIEFHIGLVQQLHQKISQYFRVENEEKNTKIQEQIPQMPNKSECKCEKQNQPQNEVIQDAICIQVSINKRQQIKPQEPQTKELISPSRAPAPQNRQTTGRIRILGPKGTHFLSARILNKLLTSSMSPNGVTNSVVRHHPYLNDIPDLVQILADKHNMQ